MTDKESNQLQAIYQADLQEVFVELAEYAMNQVGISADEQIQAGWDEEVGFDKLDQLRLDSIRNAGLGPVLDKLCQVNLAS